MAQPPFRSDQIQIEGDSDTALGTRLIFDDPNDGSLRFSDPRIPTGINLAELAGLQQAGNQIIVAPTGPGASKDSNGDPITTIQAAFDAIPDSADPNNPWTILIAPGVYQEDLVFVKTSTVVRGLGNVTIRQASANQSTIRILQGTSTIPRRVTFQNLRVENDQNGFACFDFSTAQFATGTITVAVQPNIGDNVDVNAVNLAAIANGGVPAPGEFELGLTTDETASNLADAINDPVNGLTATVQALVTGSVVTVRAFSPGVAGNLITLGTSVPLILVISGGTLTGGLDDSPNSAVAETLADIIDCDVVATGVNGYQIRAQAVNNIYVRGGNWADSGTGSFVDIRECASFRMENVSKPRRFELHYDSAAANLPILAGSAYEIVGVDSGSNLSSDLDGVGSLKVERSTFGDTSVTGTETFTFNYCILGVFDVGQTATAVLRRTTRGVLSGDPTATFSETSFSDSLAFVASNSQTYTFSSPQPDTSYQVLIEPSVPVGALTDIAVVTNKTTASFDIEFGAAQTLTVNFIVTRQL